MRNLTRKQRDEIEQLAKMSDSDIDTSDVQEATHWNQAAMARNIFIRSR